MTKELDLSSLSSTAMVLAAGFGVRMRPLTLHHPKSLLAVGGRAMLDLALDHLREVGITRAVVNAHYLGEQIATHLAARDDMKVVLSPEEEILETGGGVKKALPHLGEKPFFVLSSDLPIMNGAQPALSRMAKAWDGDRMDSLLLVMPKDKARGFAGARGDFMMEPDGRLWRHNGPEDKPYLFISAMIVNPKLYHEIHETAFSNNLIFNLAEKRGRLFGLVHDGSCYHVGTPEDLVDANRLLATGAGWG